MPLNTSNNSNNKNHKKKTQTELNANGAAKRKKNRQNNRNCENLQQICEDFVNTFDVVRLLNVMHFDIFQHGYDVLMHLDQIILYYVAHAIPDPCQQRKKKRKQIIIIKYLNVFKLFFY